MQRESTGIAFRRAIVKATGADVAILVCAMAVLRSIATLGCRGGPGEVPLPGAPVPRPSRDDFTEASQLIPRRSPYALITVLGPPQASGTSLGSSRRQPVSGVSACRVRQRRATFRAWRE